MSTPNISSELSAFLDDANILRRNGITPDPYQLEVLSFPAGGVERGLALTASRQVGKTTCCAGLCAQEALRTSGANIALVAPSERQVRLLIRTTRKLLIGAGYQSEIVSDNVMSLEFASGARIFGLSAAASDLIRGEGGLDILLIDEAAFCPEELFQIVIPMTATNPRARIIAISSPNGRSNWFARRALGDEPEWRKMRVTALDCPRIPRSFLEMQKRELGEKKFAAEFMCEFSSEGDSPVFDMDGVRAKCQPVGVLSLHA